MENVVDREKQDLGVWEANQVTIGELLPEGLTVPGGVPGTLQECAERLGKKSPPRNWVFVGEYEGKLVLVKVYKDLVYELDDETQSQSGVERQAIELIILRKLEGKGFAPKVVFPPEGCEPSRLIVYEYEEGESLDRWDQVLKAELEAGKTEGLVGKVFDTVARMHQAGVSHMDINEGNFIVRQDKVTGEWGCMIIDFEQGMILDEADNKVDLIVADYGDVVKMVYEVRRQAEGETNREGYGQTQVLEAMVWHKLDELGLDHVEALVGTVMVRSMGGHQSAEAVA